MTVNELIEALTDAVESDESLGDREICIGDVQNGKIRRYQIDDFAEVFFTESASNRIDDGEDRFWITVSQDADNFYKVPEGLRDQYR
jgi:hypothetical protein